MTDARFLDNGDSADFYPLNALKGVQELHFGVRTIAKQWQEALRDNPHIRIHSRLLPTRQNVLAVLDLPDGEGWVRDGELVARRGGEAVNVKELPEDALWLKDAAHLFELCGILEGHNPRQGNVVVKIQCLLGHFP